MRNGARRLLPGPVRVGVTAPACFVKDGVELRVRYACARHFIAKRREDVLDAASRQALVGERTSDKILEKRRHVQAGSLRRTLDAFRRRGFQFE